MSDIGETASIKVTFTISTKGPGSLPPEKEFEVLLHRACYFFDREFIEKDLEILGITVSKWDGNLEEE
jgi:hypothetical protein